MIINVWEPKYSTDSVLIDRHKVKDYTQIQFTKTNDPKYGGIFWVPGDTVKKYPLQPNGATEVYEVPFYELNQWPDEKGQRGKHD